MLKPTLISVGILELMWVWNDYLLPYLVLDRTKYMTIPIHVQYLKGSYGSVDLGATMAVIMLSITLIASAVLQQLIITCHSSFIHEANHVLCLVCQVIHRLNHFLAYLLNFFRSLG